MTSKSRPWLDSSKSSTLTGIDSTLTGIENNLDDSGSKVFWLLLDKNDSGTSQPKTYENNFNHHDSLENSIHDSL